MSDPETSPTIIPVLTVPQPVPVTFTRVRFTPKDLRRLKDFILAGVNTESNVEIARQLQRTEKAIVILRSRLGWIDNSVFTDYDRRPLSHYERQLILRWLREGQSFETIGDALGRTRSSIISIAARAKSVKVIPRTQVAKAIKEVQQQGLSPEKKKKLLKVFLTQLQKILDL